MFAKSSATPPRPVAFFLGRPSIVPMTTMRGEGGGRLDKQEIDNFVSNAASDNGQRRGRGTGAWHWEGEREGA